MTEIFQGSSNYDGDRYTNWREKRINKLIKIVGGEKWFENKKILELGCAWGHVGLYIESLGGNVTFAEGRNESIEIMINKGIPEYKCIKINQDKDWKHYFSYNEFDLIVHWGVLYHLKNWKRDLNLTLQFGKYVCLETEVTDSNDPSLVHTRKENGNDQAIEGIGSIPSVAAIEKIFDEKNLSYKRYDDEDINSAWYKYDWLEKNTGEWIGGSGGQRRYWMIHA